jgi:uncharacterized membrane protein YfcA
MERIVTTPELGLIAATRGMLGAGIGLLLAGKVSDEQRKAVGLTLLFVGIVTTVPLMMEVFGRRASLSSKSR